MLFVDGFSFMLSIISVDLTFNPLTAGAEYIQFFTFY